MPENGDPDPNPVLAVLAPNVGAAEAAPNRGVVFCVPKPNDMADESVGADDNNSSSSRTQVQHRLLHTRLAANSSLLFAFALLTHSHSVLSFYFTPTVLSSLLPNIMVENGAAVLTGANSVPLPQNGSLNGQNGNLKSTSGKAIVVLGAQWGDEGKGKLVDLLVASEKDGMNVCRCQVSN